MKNASRLGARKATCSTKLAGPLLRPSPLHAHGPVVFASGSRLGFAALGLNLCANSGSGPWCQDSSARRRILPLLRCTSLPRTAHLAP